MSNVLREYENSPETMPNGMSIKGDIREALR